MYNPSRPSVFGSLLSRLGLRSDARPQLVLHIAAPCRQAKSLEIDAQQLMARFATLKLGSTALLKEVNRYLEHLNQWEMEPERRLALTNIALGEAAAAVRMLFVRFVEQGSGVPESAEQGDGLAQGIRAAERLATSYKHIFKHDYLASTGHGHRERLRLCAVRILELGRIEQLLRAFRYQKLPESVWQDCNEVFFALRGLDEIDHAQALKIRLVVKSGAKERELFPEAASLHQLYVAIQVTGLVDPLSWPAHLIYILDRYLNSLEKPVVTQADGGAPLGVGQVVVYRGQGGPPRYERQTHEPAEAVLIDFSPLMVKVSEERKMLVEAGASPRAVSEALEDLPDLERLPFIDLMFRKLAPEKRREQRQHVYHTKFARVYRNFAEIYQLFQGLGDGDAKPAAGQVFWEATGEQTTAIEADNGNGAKHRWVVVDESVGGIQLRIRESHFIPPLVVNQLVAYGMAGEDSNKIHVGYVVRLHRAGDLEVEVAMARLPGTVQAVTVQDDGAEPRQRPALLLRDPHNQLQILCDNGYAMKTGERLQLGSRERTVNGTVGHARVTKPDFTLYYFHTVP